ncbi:MAG: chemotaxis protein CheW [Verrucomicrobiaceae bacterium]|nr:chemotaxis protein CheW [Verrucomicrobiaceae bacterium]
MSRVVDRRFIFGDAEKEHFVAIMRKLEGFLGLRVVTYVVMSNHFHLLVEEPDEEARATLDRETLLRRMPILYGASAVRSLKEMLARADRSGSERMEEQILAPYRERMGNVSVFMKELKQRFSQWYNRRNDRTGTLWETRFTSVLVEGDEKALMTIAAYIDLNPIRAGMVEKVEDYRWCGYASAAAGNRRARMGLGKILRNSPHVSGEDFEKNWAATGRVYRLWLYHEGEVREIAETADPEAAAGKTQCGFSEEDVATENARGGQLSLSQAIRHRVRYFTHGVAFGSAAFVDSVFERYRSQFSEKRNSGARRMRDADWEGLHVLRDLQRDVIT